MVCLRFAHLEEVATGRLHSATFRRVLCFFSLVLCSLWSTSYIALGLVRVTYCFRLS